MPIGAWHPFLPAALRSIAAQDVNLELAILDASEDPRVGEAVARSELKLAYHRVGPDKGQADAIAEGWASTQGEFLAWLNADDILVPGALQQVGDVFVDDVSLDIVFGDSAILDEEGSVVGLHGQVADVSERLTVSNTISQPSCFTRRCCVDRVGGLNRDLHFTMDWELWIRLYKAGCKFRRIPNILSAVYWGYGTKTSQMSVPRLWELFDLARRYSGLLPALRMMLGVATGASQPDSLLHRLVKIRHGASYEMSGLLLAADKNPRERPRQVVNIPVINPHPIPVRELTVEFSGAGGQVLPSHFYRTRANGQGCWRVIAMNEVSPSHALTVSLAAGDELARVERVSWTAERRY